VSQGSGDWQCTRAVFLVPTKELALQVMAFVKKLTVYCEGLIGVCNLSSGGASLQRSAERCLRRKPSTRKLIPS
jgi:ATP-dependent RNA helicase DDX56/DBP9